MIELAGWTVLALLIPLLVVQFRNTDALRRLDRSDRAGTVETQEIHVHVDRAANPAALELCLRSLLDQQLQPTRISVETGGDPELQEILNRFAAINPAVQRLSDPWPAHGLTVRIPFPMVFTPDALTRAIHRMDEEDLDSLAVLPRIRAGSALDPVLAPLPRFSFLTFGSVGRAHTLTWTVVLERDPEDGAERRAGEADGSTVVETVSFEEFPTLSRLHLPWNGSGAATVSLVGAVTLFTLPPVMAILSGSFPWLIATIVGLWLRLRTDVRGGHSPALAFTNPLALPLALLLSLRGK